MTKACYIVCLVLWCINLLLGIIAMIFDIPVTPLMVTAPCIMCVFHYIEKLIKLEE